MTENKRLSSSWVKKEISRCSLRGNGCLRFLRLGEAGMEFDRMTILCTGSLSLCDSNSRTALHGSNVPFSGLSCHFLGCHRREKSYSPRGVPPPEAIRAGGIFHTPQGRTDLRAVVAQEIALALRVFSF